MTANTVILAAVARYERGRSLMLCVAGLPPADALVVVTFGVAWGRWTRQPCVPGVSS